VLPWSPSGGYDGGMRRLVPLGLPFLLLLPLLWEAPAAAAKKKKKAPKAAPQAQMSEALNARRDEIQTCAIKHALERGATRVDIVTKVTINGRGQVLDSRTTVNVTGGDGEQVRTCVEGVIKGIKFPQSPAPLVTIERNWSVSAQ
jgi:hypothetical protein